MQKYTKLNMRDYEIAPNPADFIPVDPDDNYNLNGKSRFISSMKCVIANYSPGDSPNLEQVKTILCVVCQIILIFCSLVLLGLAYVVYSEANKQQSLDYYLPHQFTAPLPNEYFKLKQQCDRIHEETNLLKGQFLDLIRWRSNIQKEVQTKIENALEWYDADKIGAIDFALESDGGFVTSIPDTIPYEISVNQFIMGLINIRQFSDPQFLLKPGILPGQCFAFEGSEGKIRIQLNRNITITDVTLEHVHRSLVRDAGSAPKNFQIIGLRNEKDENGNILGRFVYNIAGKVLQTFKMPQTDESYRHVELHILSNYGNKKYTCVYRFRVHGIPID